MAAVFAPMVGVGSQYGRHNPGGCIFLFFDTYTVAFQKFILVHDIVHMACPHVHMHWLRPLVSFLSSYVSNRFAGRVLEVLLAPSPSWLVVVLVGGV